mgnify:CR=1 FL=1
MIGDPLPKALSGLRLPAVAAPLFIISTPDLVIAQCKAGVIGSFPALNARQKDGEPNMLEIWLERITEELDRHNQANPDTPAAPFAVNQIVHRSNERLQNDIEICAKWKVPIWITSLGARVEVNQAAHSCDGVVLHDIINNRFAKKAIEKGADGLIAVAAGAGGHAGSLSPLALISEIRQWFNGPLLLSGSIATGRSILAAQAMGADLAYLGTRFINTQECQSPDDYKQMIIDSRFDDIVATPAVSGVNANFLTASLDNAGVDLDAPNENGLIDIDKELAEALTSSSNEFKAWRDIWSAGHGVGSISDIPPVADLVNRLHGEYLTACSAQQDRLAALRPMGVTV